jgi:hypothetical protein
MIREKPSIKVEAVALASAVVEVSFQLECSFLKVSMKCSKQLGCHDDHPSIHQKRGFLVYSSLLKATTYKGRV